MHSRLLDRLTAQIDRATDPVHADRVRADRAFALARHGRVAEAREALQVLRGRNHLARDGSLQARVELADAIADYFGEVADSTRPKLERALGLAAQASDRTIEARCEAWLAHLDYVDDRVEDIARHAARSLTLATADEHTARARACMVVGMVYQYAGHFDRAQPWYTLSRQHASAEGDDATLSSLLYNLAALRGELVRRASVFSDAGAVAEEVRQALSAWESSTHFDQRLGGSPLEVLRPISRACILLAQGSYAQALVLYEAHFAGALAAGLDRMASSVRAEAAWCRVKLRQIDIARQQALAAEAELPAAINDDDIAITHGRLQQVYAELGEAARAEIHGALAQRHWQRHCERRRLSIELMDRACGPFLSP